MTIRDDHMNCNIFFLKIENLSEFLILLSRLFHSVTVDGLGHFSLLMQWHDSIWSGEILQPILSKISNTISSSTSPLTSQGMPTMSRHSCLEYCAFAQHCRSKVTNLLDNRVLAFFVIDSSELSLVIVSDKLRTSSRTLLLASLLASSSFLCRDKTG